MAKASYVIARACERVGLSRPEVAALIGVSPATVDMLVRQGLMPQPRAVGTRRLWYRQEVERAFLDLPFADDRPERPEDGWD